MGNFFCCLSGIKIILVNVKSFLTKNWHATADPTTSIVVKTIEKKFDQSLCKHKSNDTIYVFNLMVTKLASITTLSCTLPIRTHFKIIANENRVLGIVQKIDLDRGFSSEPNEMICHDLVYKLEVNKEPEKKNNTHPL
jgi:hypothetical protein